jgi:hypothetical protein
MNAPRTEIIHGSQMPELVRRIFEIRDPEAFPKYRKALARWERRAKGKEIHVRKGRDSLFGNEPIGTFFKARAYGEDVEVFKPEPPGSVAYSHIRYRRFGDMAFPASDRGLFANATYNREMRPQRVVQYAQAMVLGDGEISCQTRSRSRPTATWSTASIESRPRRTRGAGDMRSTAARPTHPTIRHSSSSGASIRARRSTPTVAGGRRRTSARSPRSC